MARVLASKDVKEVVISLIGGVLVSLFLIIVVGGIFLGPGTLLLALGDLALWGFVAWLIFREPEPNLALAFLNSSGDESKGEAT